MSIFVAILFLGAISCNQRYFFFGDAGQDNTWAPLGFGRNDPKVEDKLKEIRKLKPELGQGEPKNFAKIIELAKKVYKDIKVTAVSLGDASYNEAKNLPTKKDAAQGGDKDFGWVGAAFWLTRANVLLNAVHALVKNSGFVTANEYYYIVGNHQFDSDPIKLLTEKGKLQNEYKIKGEYYQKDCSKTATPKEADYLFRYPRVVVDGIVTFLDVNFAVMSCGVAGDFEYWTLGEGLDDNTFKTQICPDYLAAVKCALADIKKDTKSKWKVLRSHETFYNIEGDLAIKGKYIAEINNFIGEFVDAGIRVHFASHFHCGAFMWKNLAETIEDGLKKCALRDANIGDAIAVVHDKDKDLHVTMPSNHSKTLAKNIDLSNTDKTKGEWVQFVIGHSGRFLDPIHGGRGKCGTAIIEWARGKDKNAEKFGGDKYGFADVVFSDTTIVATYYNVIDGTTPEMTITLTNKKARRRRVNKKLAKKQLRKMKRRNRKLKRRKF